MTAHLCVDTSALLKALRREAETDDLLRHLAAVTDPLASSEVTVTELHRAARWLGVPGDEVERRLAQLDLVPLTRSQLRAAVHLAAAAHVGSGALLCYDRNQSRAARAAGLRLVHPGRPDDWFA